MKHIFDGEVYKIYDRASEILRDSPFQEQLRKLYMAVNIIDALTTKPADMLVGEGLDYESGLDDESVEQQALNRIVERNNLDKTIHEMLIGAGIKGDVWLKTYHAPRYDLDALNEEGLDVPEELKRPEAIIEAVPADTVFPELAKASRKKFKAVNICSIEWKEEKRPKLETYWVKEDIKEIPYLNVERHFPGWIKYEKYKMVEGGVDNTFGAPVPIFFVDEQVETDWEEDLVETGVPDILVKHVPYKSVDDDWKGVGNIEKLDSILAAINDRLVQIDYILWKHADPTAYGPDIEQKEKEISWGGKYIPVEKEDHEPGYMTWDGRLDMAFKELDYLLSIVYQMSETPQWLFGTTITQDAGGTGTSHTDARAIQMRLMPILSKVNRIKIYADGAVRDVLYMAQKLENFAYEGVEDFTSYTPIRPKVHWHDPLPKDPKEEAEVMAIRTGEKETLDVHSAVKRLDNVNDEQAQEIIKRIEEDREREEAEDFVDGSVFNEPLDKEEEEDEEEGEG